MKIRIGYELIYDCAQPTPMILTLSVHYTRVSDIIIPDHLIAEPPVPLTAYRDSFGNWCSRIVAPKGPFRLWQFPNVETLNGKRDRAIIAVLLGCGLRRRELSDLSFGDTADLARVRDSRASETVINSLF